MKNPIELTMNPIDNSKMELYKSVITIDDTPVDISTRENFETAVRSVRITAGSRPKEQDKTA